MDFSQTKLSKTEWESIEIPVSDNEKYILKLIQDGFCDVNIKQNNNLSLLLFMKISYTPEIEMYLYSKYFEKEIHSLLHVNGDSMSAPNDSKSKSKSKKATPVLSQMFKEFKPTLPNISKFKAPKKVDLLRLNNTDSYLQNKDFDRSVIAEYIQLEFCRHILYAVPGNHVSYSYYLYTLMHIKESVIIHINKYVQEFIDQLIVYTRNQCSDKIVRDTFLNAYDIIEKNHHILRFENKVLYDHQKQLFQLFHIPENHDASAISPKLVLYTAPTGTGKTMSPLGLSNGYRIIYICAARHIGLALAKSAISMEKRVAFAFGCETASDIRLHFYSAVDYTRNRKTGGIYKVDNGNGSKVQIMICDIQSYRVAMHYMLSFHAEEEIILYWDEPTISLDTESHPLHTIIQNNWKENKISKVVLSCATLPNETEIVSCLDDYRARFEGGEVHRISSIDCKKSISLLDSQGMPVLPHLLFSSYSDILRCIAQMERNPSLLRYLDLREIIRFEQHLESVKDALPEECYPENYFKGATDIHMNSLKTYYIHLLRHISPEKYGSVHEYLKCTRRPTFTASNTNQLVKNQSVDTAVSLLRPSEEKPLVRTMSTFQPPSTFPSSLDGVWLTTKDAHTLTDGPTIYIVEDVNRMGNFYAQHSQIPGQILDSILEKIEMNNQIQKKMDSLMKTLDDMIGSEVEKEHKMGKDNLKPEAKRLTTNIEALRSEIQMITIGMKYTPNTPEHQQVWVPNASPGNLIQNAYVPRVDDASILKIMELDVQSHMKLLLLMGIGVFDTLMMQTKSSGVNAYVEVMKRLAYEQKLYLIIASSDYIYGTNYQLCHGFLGKDLTNMTQQKIIQAMGRIGRSHIQQEYTIRFRDETLISKLFLPVENNMEAINMCKLLS